MIPLLWCGTSVEELEVHANKKSRTREVFTMGKWAIISSSTNQKVNSQRSTESGLIGVDNKISKVLVI